MISMSTFTVAKTKPELRKDDKTLKKMTRVLSFQKRLATIKKPRKSGELLRGQKINNMKHKNCAPFRT